MGTSVVSAVFWLCLPAAAFAGPFDGKWHATVQTCQVQGFDTDPVVVGGGKVKFYENTCDIGPANGRKANLLCSGEGETWVMNIARKGEDLTIGYDGEAPTLYKRCNK